jgi:serine/threonine protein kinase
MLGEEQDVVTRSFCGTEQYMSPEMLLQQGHNFRMDWWCVGLLMHEMLSARHPFSGPSHYDTLRNMVTKQPNVDSRVSSGAASVVRSLLIKNPRARMCCQRGASELKNLAYFSDLDWDALIEKRIPMAHIPELSGETDLSSFETTFTKEAPVDSMATDASGVAGSVASKGSSSSKSEKKGGILSYLGLNDSSSAKKAKEKEAEAAAADNFKDFSFVKQEDAPSAAAAATSDGDGAGAGNADSTADSAASGGGEEEGAPSRSKAGTPALAAAAAAAAGAPPAFKPAAPIRKASATPAADTAGAAVPPPGPI